MRHFTVIPSVVTSSLHGSRASPSTSKATLQGSLSKQSQANKETLQKKYKEDDLYVTTTSYKSDNKMSLSCSAGDLIGAIKRQDPLGSATRWFCDDGATQGFLPSKILKSYSSLVKTSTPKKSENPQPSPSSTIETPTSQIQRKSPTPSSLSSGSSSSLPSLSSRLAPNADMPTRNASIEKKESLEKEKSYALIDPNKMRMKAYWDRKKLTERQKYRLDFEFTARSTLELTVRQGDLVELVEEHDMDGNAEWWLVANAEGKQGYIPANYMSKIEYL